MQNVKLDHQYGIVKYAEIFTEIFLNLRTGNS